MNKEDWQKERSFSSMKYYVLGFYFDCLLSSVVLIKKNKPKWQRGKLNGIGGKIERNETPLNAMIREFKEETGLDVNNWIKVSAFKTSSHQGCATIFVYTSKSRLVYEELNPIFPGGYCEYVEWYEFHDMDNLSIIPNILWLIEMCKIKFNYPRFKEELELTTRFSTTK